MIAVQYVLVLVVLSTINKHRILLLEEAESLNPHPWISLYLYQILLHLWIFFEPLFQSNKRIQIIFGFEFRLENVNFVLLNTTRLKF